MSQTPNPWPGVDFETIRKLLALIRVHSPERHESPAIRKSKLQREQKVIRESKISSLQEFCAQFHPNERSSLLTEVLENSHRVGMEVLSSLKQVLHNRISSESHEILREKDENSHFC